MYNKIHIYILFINNTSEKYVFVCIDCYAHGYLFLWVHMCAHRCTCLCLHTCGGHRTISGVSLQVSWPVTLKKFPAIVSQTLELSAHTMQYPILHVSSGDQNHVLMVYSILPTEIYLLAPMRHIFNVKLTQKVRRLK